MGDFQPNCSCFLLPTASHYNAISSKLGNRSTSLRSLNENSSVYLFVDGHQIPLFLFNFFVLPDQARDKLNRLIPRGYESQLDIPLPEAVFDQSDFDEHVGLIVMHSNSLQSVLQYLTEKVFYSPSARDKLASWCSLEDCRLFIDEQIAINRTTRTYDFAVEFAHGFQLPPPDDDRFVFAFSTVRSRFVLAKLRTQFCRHQCQRVIWSTREFCVHKCTHDFEYKNMAFVGEVKRHWQEYARSMAIDNLRRRYSDFFPDKPLRSFTKQQ
uniref:Uncharacterized protein n=1 Tax=Plectus sambesii TaxID=2011161 RepID=A0A914W266_9BILA